MEVVVIFPIYVTDINGGDGGGCGGDLQDYRWWVVTPSFSSSGVCDTWPCHCRDLLLAGTQTQLLTQHYSCEETDVLQKHLNSPLRLIL